MRDVRLFKRGQVWMVLEDERITKVKISSGDHTIAKTRPCLIITDTEVSANNRDTMVQVIPISSQLTNIQDDDVVFMNANYEQNKLVVSQLTSKDARNLSFYMYSFSSEMMKRVDELIANRLHMNISSIKEDEITNKDERIKELEKQNEELKRKLDTYKKFINSNYYNDAKSETFKTIPEIQQTHDTRECRVGITPTYKRPQNTDENRVITINDKPTRNKYRTWDQDSSKEFVEYFEMNGTTDTANKYGYSKGGARATYKRLKNKFNL